MSKPRAFKTQQDFRRWLAKNHATEKALILRLYKVHAKDQGIGYREALDESLCWGWIDGVVRRLDQDSFQQRFTPRTPRSNWSAVNIKRMKTLIAEGKVAKAGLAAFDRRNATKPAPYSSENKGTKLAPAFVKRLKAEPKAWAFFDALPPGYKHLMVWRVMSAKREETRERRFAQLFAYMRTEKRMPLLGEDT
jgi:uncharacterized protein YdeI (YjbR/CyaY-like superfamily)